MRRRRRMTKFTKTPDHNQNTLSGGFEKNGLSCSVKETWEAGMKISCNWQCKGTREMEELEISMNKTEKSISTKRRGL